jgi:hypothetical protein
MTEVGRVGRKVLQGVVVSQWHTSSVAQSNGGWRSMI